MQIIKHDQDHPLRGYTQHGIDQVAGKSVADPVRGASPSAIDPAEMVRDVCDGCQLCNPGITRQLQNCLVNCLRPDMASPAITTNRKQVRVARPLQDPPEHGRLPRTRWTRQPNQTRNPTLGGPRRTVKISEHDTTIEQILPAIRQLLCYRPTPTRHTQTLCHECRRAARNVGSAAQRLVRI